MKYCMLLVTLIVASVMVTACSGEVDYLNSYAHIQAYRVENLSFGSDKQPIIRMVHFTAITDVGDTLTLDDFDTVRVIDVGVEAPRGNLLYGYERGANGRYPLGKAYIILGNAFTMRYQERW